MLQYKINVFAELNNIGMNTTKAKETQVFSQAIMKKFRNQDTNINITTLNKLCCLLEMQPRDILKYTEEEEDKKMLEKVYKKSVDNHEKP